MGDSEVTQKKSFPYIIDRPFITGVLSFLPLVLTLAILAWVDIFLHDISLVIFAIPLTRFTIQFVMIVF